MIDYNSQAPLISLHIPKCGGQSIRRVLNQWFDSRFKIHYFQQFNAMPPKHDLKPGLCIHGHFNRDKQMGADHYYPEIRQFITVVRDPLEMAISNYFFWKRKERARKLSLGLLKEGDSHDYRDIDDFFVKRPQSQLPLFMPMEITQENYRDIIDNYFVWIGFTDELQSCVDMFAQRLGFPKVEVAHINDSQRDEELSPAIRDRFLDRNRFAFEIIDYIRRKYGN